MPVPGLWPRVLHLLRGCYLLLNTRHEQAASCSAAAPCIAHRSNESALALLCALAFALHHHGIITALSPHVLVDACQYLCLNTVFAVGRLLCSCLSLVTPRVLNLDRVLSASLLQLQCSPRKQHATIPLDMHLTLHQHALSHVQLYELVADGCWREHPQVRDQQVDVRGRRVVARWVVHRHAARQQRAHVHRLVLQRQVLRTQCCMGTKVLCASRRGRVRARAASSRLQPACEESHACCSSPPAG